MYGSKLIIFLQQIDLEIIYFLFINRGSKFRREIINFDPYIVTCRLILILVEIIVIIIIVLISSCIYIYSNHLFTSIIIIVIPTRIKI